MILVGLTGQSGAGKGCVAAVFARHGAFIIDADAVYHRLIAGNTPCTRALSEAFGTEILTSCGGIDRRKLADVVFAPDSERDARILLLNRLTHHYVLDETQNRMEQAAATGMFMTVFDAPALIESGFDQSCDCVIAVTADRETRIRRIMERDGIGRDAACQRVDAQKPQAFYTARANYLIENDGTISALEQRATEIFRAVSEYFTAVDHEKK